MKRRRTYAGDRLAIQEKLGGTGRERIMASRADDSFRGEERRGVATTTTTSSSRAVHLVGRFKLAADTSVSTEEGGRSYARDNDPRERVTAPSSGTTPP